MKKSIFSKVTAVVLSLAMGLSIATVAPGEVDAASKKVYLKTTKGTITGLDNRWDKVVYPTTLTINVKKAKGVKITKTSFKSSDKKVVKVTKKNNTKAVVKAVAIGKTKVVATVKYKIKKKSYTKKLNYTVTVDKELMDPGIEEDETKRSNLENVFLEVFNDDALSINEARNNAIKAGYNDVAYKYDSENKRIKIKYVDGDANAEFYITADGDYVQFDDAEQWYGKAYSREFIKKAAELQGVNEDFYGFLEEYARDYPDKVDSTLFSYKEVEKQFDDGSSDTLITIKINCNKDKATALQALAKEAGVALHGNDDLYAFLKDAADNPTDAAGSSLKTAILASRFLSIATTHGYRNSDIDMLKEEFTNKIKVLDLSYEKMANLDDALMYIFREYLDPAVDNDNYASVKAKFEDAGVGAEMEKLLATTGIKERYDTFKSAYLTMGNSDD